MTLTRDCLDRCGGVALAGRSRCRACEAIRQRKRNAKPSRIALYGGTWAAESKAIRRASPWCVVCGVSDDLTVDHPTRKVYCRSHHNEMEGQRNREARSQAYG